MKTLIVALTLLGLSLGEPFDRFRGPKSGSRMINGQLAPPGAFPYVVSLRAFFFGYDDLHYCGGAIITPRTILTAGHCVDWLPATAIDVVFGSNQLDCKGTRYRAVNTTLHPSYNDTIFTDDIGLVFVGQDIQYGPNIQPILPDYSFIGFVPVVSMGWGRTVIDIVTPSNDLLFINETTISPVDCRDRLDGIFRPLTDGEICTLTPPGTGSCNNDAGGPIVYENRVIGIIALGVGCASEYPEVAIRVSHYRDWIEGNKI